MTLDGLLDTPDVDHVAADADNHAIPCWPRLLLLRDLPRERPQGKALGDGLAHQRD